ncbi:MAG: inorganic phosphate transporter [Candidatus Marsarchaeota archaeon]|nr:inorganic phosphate transporter [Candidatus Marsarchaeota archaeon]MCL5094470.1 inorganic phosphate transporter [Candidatus Marsarchaeota archaeon]
MFDILILIIGFILVSFVSGNNLPACSGTIIASKMVSKKNGVLLTIAGYVLGLVLEGKFLKQVSTLLPGAGFQNQYLFTFILFAIAALIFFFANRQKVPQSLSIIFTSSIIGMDIALNIKIPLYFLIKLIGFWIIAPLVSLIFSLILIRAFYKKRSKNIFSALKTLKFLSVLFAFLTAFTLGANTIGLILVSMPYYNYSIIVLILGIIFGSIFLNKNSLKRISSEIVSLKYLNSVVSQAASFIFVEVATLFSIPLSNTQIFVTSLYGTAFGYRQRLLVKKTMFSIMSSWILLIAVSIASSFVIISIIH